MIHGGGLVAYAIVDATREGEGSLGIRVDGDDHERVGGVAPHDVVVTARYGALEPWWHEYTDADHAEAPRALAASSRSRSVSRVIA